MVSLGRVYPSTPAGLEAPPRLRLWPLPTVLALALLAYNVAQVLTAPFERIAPAGYRCWDDFGVAVRLYRHDRARPATAESSDFAAARQEVERLSLRPWQFWRTADESRFPGVSALDAIRPLDDVGRGRLLGALFRLRRGIAPWLPFWMAPLAALAALLWTSWECARVGRPAAGAVFVLLVASSAFVADVLPLSYSAVGFYLAAVLLLVPWAACTVLGRPGARGLIVRAAVVGAALAACVFCRSGALLVLPGFLLALVFAARRLPRRRRAAVLVVAAVLLTAPALSMRSRAGGHEIWITLWEGLGDFDSTKGHVWSDAEAKRAARRQGADELRSKATLEVLRRDVLDSVRADPLWYVGILGRRAVATLTQRKLWGRGMRPSTRPGEGVMDGYYGLTRHVDVFGIGRSTVEIPVPVLLAGPLVLLVLAWTAPPPRRGPLTDSLALLLCLIVGTAGVPVIVSTAGAVETQAAAIEWLLAWALALDALAGLRHARAVDRAASPA